nr:MAG TPA: hypothetical protein [Caudoviricetes sp.]
MLRAVKKIVAQSGFFYSRKSVNQTFKGITNLVTPFKSSQ